jgi:hypothetical protein
LPASFTVINLIYVRRRPSRSPNSRSSETFMRTEADDVPNPNFPGVSAENEGILGSSRRVQDPGASMQTDHGPAGTRSHKSLNTMLSKNAVASTTLPSRILKNQAYVFA